MSSETGNKSSAEIENHYGTPFVNKDTGRNDREEARHLIALMNTAHGLKMEANGPEFKKVRRALSGVTYESFAHGDLAAAEELLSLD